jgi:hypothetical protein
MSVSSTSVSQERGPLRPAQTRFVTSFFHTLKGWCYLPAGGLIATATLTAALVRPEWLETTWGPISLVAGAVLITAPWAYVMHRRYRQAYGHVTTGDEEAAWPLGREDLSLPEWMAYMLGMLSWLAVLMIYIPQQSGYDDNHMIFFLTALPLAKAIVAAPAFQHRLVYSAAILLLIAVTLLPLLGWPVVRVQTICYTTLGVVVAGLGFYNHRSLVNVLGPLSAEEGRNG